MTFNVALVRVNHKWVVQLQVFTPQGATILFLDVVAAETLATSLASVASTGRSGIQLVTTRPSDS